MTEWRIIVKSSKIILIIVLLIGIDIFVVGFYYMAIKAGIPYQDPTPEMLREYNRNMMIGEVVSLGGGIIILLDIIGWITYFITHSANSRKVLIIALLMGVIALAAGICFEVVAKMLYEYPHPDNLYVMLGFYLCLGGGITILLDVIGWIIYTIKFIINKLMFSKDNDTDLS